MAGLFPKPEFRGRDRYWSLESIEQWEREQAARPRERKLRGFAARRAVAAQETGHER
jgi:hypothetical protein